MKGLMPDHVHMTISIPPKYAVSQVIGYVKGKSAIHLARVYGERRRQPSGPRSKSWLRNVVTSQPIRANSWSSPPVRGWRPRSERCPHAIVARAKHENRPLILTRRLPLRDQVIGSPLSLLIARKLPFRFRPDRATRRMSGFVPAVGKRTKANPPIFEELCCGSAVIDPTGSVTLPNRARNRSPGTSGSRRSDDFIPRLQGRCPESSVRSC